MAKLIKREAPNIIWSEDGSHKENKGKNKNKPKASDLNPEEISLKIGLEKKKRGGKTVSIIMDIPYNPDYFQKLTKRLKNTCGTGGSYKESSIEIQGDHRQKLKAELPEM